MKRFIILCLSAAVALSLSACTPTPQKQAETAETMPPTTEAFKADTMEIRNSGNEDLPEMATVSIYRVNKNGTGLLQEMDALETEELEAQGIIDLMISDYEVLDEGVELLGFEVKEGKGVLNLSKITDSEDPVKIQLVVEALVNTFTENYELENGLILQENGEVYTIDSVEADEDGAMYYNDAYRKLVGAEEDGAEAADNGDSSEGDSERKPEIQVLQ